MYGKSPAGEHRHKDVGDVNENRTKDLLGHVEEPNLEGPLRSFPPALENQREQSKGSKCTLDKNGKGTKEFTFPRLPIVC